MKAILTINGYVFAAVWELNAEHFLERYEEKVNELFIENRENLKISPAMLKLLVDCGYLKSIPFSPYMYYVNIALTNRHPSYYSYKEKYFYFEGYYDYGL